jgi:hypothetical protein
VKKQRQKAEGRRQTLWTAVASLLLTLGYAAEADDVPALVQERAAIEQVYYQHRLGQKPPFEQVAPPSVIERLVKADLRKEAALRRAYGLEVTTPLLDAEVQRINTTTRAPEMLAEIKAALHHDPVKFARAFAKPILVERLLRDKFENDDALHAATRRACEAARAGLLAAKTNGASAEQLLARLRGGGSNAVTETTWQLTARPAETNAPAPDELEIKQRFGPAAQIIGSPREQEKGRKHYFEDLPAALRNVLRAQLRQPGDISAVIETPGAFLLYLAKERTDTALTVACLTLPKRSYEQWLEEQNGNRSL